MAKATKSCCMRKERLVQDSGFKVLRNDNDTDMTRHHFFSLIYWNMTMTLNLGSMPRTPHPCQEIH